ncbi:MAG: hypothetical protein JRJ38_18870 [Deltaproteobacteria bacterium]|nr:hypothetical protein [Deltaproteobacteria bacterium]
MLRIAYLVFFILILIPSASLAESKIIFAEHKYVMGDNDSKNDARRMCFLEAKRRVLEKAGTYIESRTEVKDFRLTKDEISAYAAALLKVDVVKEEWKFIGENMAILISVKAEVDMNSIENQLSKIKQDTSVQKKIKDQQSRLQELERNVVKLQKQLATVDAPKAVSLRKERNVVFKEIDELQAKKVAILSKIKSAAKDALKYIERGMTPNEVISLIGQPRSETAVNYWNYGDVWVVFEHGLVGCIVYSKCFELIPCEYQKSGCIAK